MINYDPLFQQLSEAGLSSWEYVVTQHINSTLIDGLHGDLKKWQYALACLPELKPSIIDLSDDVILVGSKNDYSENTRRKLEEQLRVFMPWRKGPFKIFGVDIDTEWRSDLKWNRVKPHIAPLDGRVILDVGCGSGYYCWRMQGEGARLVIGIDPTILYCMQYFVLQKYIKSTKTFVLPFSTDNLPETINVFDTIFSMGVLYHRRSPIDHLSQLWDWLRPGGELVLETLIIEGNRGQALLPDDRYAKMRNVWFIPSCESLTLWMQRCNYENIRCVDVTKTTSKEQRSTDWMRFESLKEYLDPDDDNKTVEGHPAPIRATFIANKPD